MAHHPMGNGTGLTRIIKAGKISLQGLRASWKHESAFRQEMTLALFFTPLAFWLGQGITQKLLLLGCVVLVLIVELLNSGIEAVVDRVGIEYHELAGRAKDMGSAAVFLSLNFTALAFILVATDRFLI